MEIGGLILVLKYSTVLSLSKVYRLQAIYWRLRGWLGLFKPLMCRGNHWLRCHWSGRLTCTPVYFILLCLRLFVCCFEKRGGERTLSFSRETCRDVYREAISIGVKFLGHACTIPLNFVTFNWFAMSGWVWAPDNVFVSILVALELSVFLSLVRAFYSL